MALSWSEEGDKRVVSGISFSVDEVSLTDPQRRRANHFFPSLQEKPLLAVVGPVGAGKVCPTSTDWLISLSLSLPSPQTTLLQCLLGELQPVEGTAEVRGQVSYASQEPWVFSGSLRDNILLGKTFEPGRYQSVLEACALDKACLSLSLSLSLSRLMSCYSGCCPVGRSSAAAR